MAVSVNRHGNLVLDFYCYAPNGEKIRCRESTRLPNNKANLKIARARMAIISNELKLGKFDYLRHFPEGSKAHLFREQPGQMSFGKFWEIWLSEKSLRATTREGWMSAYANYIGPSFGNALIQSIDESQVLSFRVRLEGKGLASSTINDKVMKPLRMCLLKAYKRGLISTYPCAEIKKLLETPEEVDPFSFEELQQLLAFAKDNYPYWYDLFVIWPRIGLRPGEIYGLKWPRIDYFNRKILVRETRTRRVDGPPKTPSSRRSVDMRPAVFEALKRQEARTKLVDPEGYVFLNEKKRPLGDEYMRQKVRHILSRADIRLRPPKQMRHTFATLHLGAGEQISWVSRMLGHANSKITWERYNRFVPNLTREDGSAFEEAMGRAEENLKAAQKG